MKKDHVLFSLLLTMLFFAACGCDARAPRVKTSSGSDAAGHGVSGEVPDNEKGGSMAHGTLLPAGHPPAGRAPTPDQIDLGNIAKAEGGVTVEELFAGKADLAGKEIVLRGKVVKVNPQIMGKNWLHVRDGSGDATAGTHDLTVTSNATAKVGDTVLVRGKLALDKDFGYGYKYSLIIEDAAVTPEKPAAETGKPAAKPEKPAAETGKPAAKPEKPAAETGKPAAETGKPAAKPEKPAAEPEKPAAKPEKPAATPEA